jgi:hypothetical protein
VRKTTQQRKEDGYARDRRSISGDSSKASRKHTAHDKRHRNRAERRLAHASFGPEISDDPDAESLAAARVLRKRRVARARRLPDAPPTLIERAMGAKHDMMAYASKKLRQLLDRARGRPIAARRSRVGAGAQGHAPG